MKSRRRVWIFLFVISLSSFFLGGAFLVNQVSTAPSPTYVSQTSVWHDSFCYSSEECKVGDFNGDGKDDIMALVRRSKDEPGIGDVWVATSDHDKFVSPSVWHGNFCRHHWPCEVGDANGDNKADLVSFDIATNNALEMVISQGEYFSQEGTLTTGSGDGYYFGKLDTSFTTFRMGDIDGDGRDDVVAFAKGDNLHDEETGRVIIRLPYEANGGYSYSMAKEAVWHNLFCLSGELCETGDFNGDGKDDIVAFARESKLDSLPGVAKVALSNGKDKFKPTSEWNDNLCETNELVCRIGDYNGDSKDDVFIFYRSSDTKREGDVWVALSKGDRFINPFLIHDTFCYRNEICDVGDFNGDGKTDLVAFTRDDTGDVWVAISSGKIMNTGIQSTENKGSSQEKAVVCGNDLQINGWARVTEIGNSIYLRSEPGADKSVITTVPKKKIVKVVDGPTVIDGIPWWQVTYGKHTGWAVECNKNGYVFLVTGSDGIPVSTWPAPAATDTP